METALAPAAIDISVIEPETQNAKLKTQNLVPTWDHEIELRSKGHRLLAGVDEVGRGAWAGPLVAAAVMFPPDMICPPSIASELERLRDSKLLSACIREELLGCIQSIGLAIGVGIVSSGLLDVIGLGPANRLAMARAV